MWMGNRRIVFPLKLSDSVRRSGRVSADQLGELLSPSVGFFVFSFTAQGGFDDPVGLGLGLRS